VWRGHGLYFGLNPTISKGFEENCSELLVTVYCKTASSCVCKKLRKPGSGLWINENCLGKDQGQFQIAILTLTQDRKIKPSQWLVPCSRSKLNNDRHSIPEDLNLPWKKAGILELLHYSPYSGTCTAVMNTNNSTQYAMANKHQLNITNSQIHTKTQHSNLRHTQIYSILLHVSVSQSLWSSLGRDKMQVQKKNCYRGGLNLENCKMWCSSGTCVGSTAVSHLQ